MKVPNSLEAAMAIPTALRRLILLTGVGLAGLLAGPVVWAQAIPPLSSHWSPGAVPGGGGIAVSDYPIVTGEPFSADYNTRSVEIRNGKRKVHESHSFVARDSAGRVATRTPESPHVRYENGVSFVIASGTISDPAAGVVLDWEEGEPPPWNDVAFKRRIRPNKPLLGPQALSACEVVGGHPRDEPYGANQQVTDLGERTIQNIPARGCRLTAFIPAGSIHNGQPLASTYESWVSPQLRIILIRVDHNPRTSDTTEQLDNIATGEPDPSLFQPPPGYKIRDVEAERVEEERSQVTLGPGEPDAETLAGNWETDDPFARKRSQIGILVNINANRRVPFHQGKVAGDGPQKIASFYVRVYERVARKDEGGFFTTAKDGGASFNGHLLQIKADGSGSRRRARRNGRRRKCSGTIIQCELALDLTFDGQKRLWIGTYTRNDVTRPVVLARPRASLKAASNPFLGGWSENIGVGGSGSRCVHIAQGLDGTFLAWDDARNGAFVDLSEDMTTATFQENVGDALGVHIKGHTLTLEEGIYWGGVAGQGPRKFTGKLSADKSRIVGSWGRIIQVKGAKANPGAGEVTTFTRMADKSCWSQGPK